MLQAMPDETTLPLPSRGTLMGFDFGLARIGIAIGELETATANALTTIHAESNQERFAAINALIAEWKPIALIVGIPFHQDGETHTLTTRCHRFANQLHGRFNLPVFTFDERFSSIAADQALISTGMHDWRTRKMVLDATAAQIILQNFLDARKYASTTPAA